MKTRFLGGIALLCLMFLAVSPARLFSAATEGGEEGLKTVLTPLGSSYAVGEPMRFRLEMSNTGKAAIIYSTLQNVWLNDGQFFRIVLPRYPGAFVEFSNCMAVKDAASLQAPFIANVIFQTMVGSSVIEPGETVVLDPDFDIASLYNIDKPGQYTVQFLGRYGSLQDRIPASNTLTIEVAAGKGDGIESIIDKLLKILPPDWKILLYTRDGTVSPAGRDKGAGTRIVLSYFSGTLSEATYINIWIMQEPAEKAAMVGGQVYPLGWEGDIRSFDAMDEVKSGAAAEFLGKIPSGYVYFLAADKAKLKWPDFEKELTGALDIK